MDGRGNSRGSLSDVRTVSVSAARACCTAVVPCGAPGGECRRLLSLCPRHVKALPFGLYVFESVKVQAAKAPLNSETLSIAVGSFSLASLLINRYCQVTF